MGLSLVQSIMGGTSHITLNGVTENVKFDATAAANHYLGIDAHHWATTSGGVHSKAWHLASTGASRQQDDQSAGTRVVGSATLGVLTTSRALLRAIDGFTGFSTHPEQERIFRREKGLLSLLNGGVDPLPVSLAEHESRGPKWRPSTLGDAAFRRNFT